jgi:DNA-binding NarL/FixJ family response regulator
MSDDASGNWRTGAAIMFAMIAILIGTDLWTDRNEGAGFAHLSIETIVLATAAFGALMLSRRIRAVDRALAEAKDDAARWRGENRQLVSGLSAAIKAQFQAWSLTEAESDIGLLLLKGLSHKEIADIRQTSERTVREQARALYRKSNLSGRNDLAAFFLEDLLPARD